MILLLFHSIESEDSGSSGSDTDRIRRSISHTEQGELARTNSDVNMPSRVADNDNDSDDRGMAVTITSSGKAIQDKYGRLVSNRSWSRPLLQDGKEYTTQPIMLRECDLDDYKSVPRSHMNSMKAGIYPVVPEKAHGRRVNDEVELFPMEDGKVCAKQHGYQRTMLTCVAGNARPSRRLGEERLNGTLVGAGGQEQCSLLGVLSSAKRRLT